MEASSSSSYYLPQWLTVLLKEKFFDPCLAHVTIRKNEKNIFCLDCCSTLCPHCLSTHRSHRFLQIRRYVYHDVIRLEDLEKLIDCDFVQSYSTNGARVIFVNERPQTSHLRGIGNLCSTCQRSLQEPYLFCSLACKVSQLVKSEGGIARHLYECECLSLTENCCYELDDIQMTPESVLEQPVSMLTSSGSSVGGGVGRGGCRTLACTATTEIVRKKRSSLSASKTRYRPTSPDIGVSNANRRKALPQRSPLY